MENHLQEDTEARHQNQTMAVHLPDHLREHTAHLQQEAHTKVRPVLDMAVDQLTEARLLVDMDRQPVEALILLLKATEEVPDSVMVDPLQHPALKELTVLLVAIHHPVKVDTEPHPQHMAWPQHLLMALLR